LCYKKLFLKPLLVYSLSLSPKKNQSIPRTFSKLSTLAKKLSLLSSSPLPDNKIAVISFSITSAFLFVAE